MSWGFHHVRKRSKGVESSSPAGGLLHPLVAVQDTFQELRHEGFEVGVGGLGDHPMRIATQGPAGDGANQGLFVTQTLDEVRDELWQVWHHALHATWGVKGGRSAEDEQL